MAGGHGGRPPAARRVRAAERQARSRRHFRQGSLLAACGLVLQAGVAVLDRSRAGGPAAAGPHADALYFAGSAIALLLLAAAGVMVWRSIRPGSGDAAGHRRG